MPENSDSIETLRKNFRDAKSQKLGDQMMAFLRLVIHPDVTLADLLNGLEYPGVVAESAALNLHVLMQIPIRERIAVTDRLFWKDALENVNAGQNDKITVWIKGDPGRTKAWQKCLSGIQIVK
jgi:hypothetical protein